MNAGTITITQAQAPRFARLCSFKAVAARLKRWSGGSGAGAEVGAAGGADGRGAVAAGAAGAGAAVRQGVGVVLVLGPRPEQEGNSNEVGGWGGKEDRGQTGEEEGGR